MKKYLTFFFRDQRFLPHFVILAALSGALVFLHQYAVKQRQSLKILEKERDLVLKIDEMKNKIHAKMMVQEDVQKPNLNSSPIKVEGMIYKNKQAFALINNVIYKEGDTFGDYKVVKISKNSLILLNSLTHEEEKIIFSKPFKKY